MKLKSKNLISYYREHPEDYDLGFIHYNLEIDYESEEEYKMIEEDLNNIKEYVGDAFFKIYISDIKDLRKLSEHTNILQDYVSYLTVRVRNENEYNEISKIVPNCHLIVPYEELQKHSYLKKSKFPITINVNTIKDLSSVELDKLREEYPIDSVNLGQICHATEDYKSYYDQVDEYFHITSDNKEVDYAKVEKEIMISNDIYSIDEYKLIDRKLHELVDGISGDDYTRVEKLYNKIISTIHYDDYGLNNNSLNAQNLLGGLIDHTCVCEGYSKIFQQALSLLGIPSIVIGGGDSKASGGHLWNQVFVDGSWYHVDTTVGAMNYAGDEMITDILKTKGIVESDSLIQKDCGAGKVNIRK